MKDLLVASGVLILALAALRAVPWLSHRARYALWLLVLLRLALPAALPQSEASVLNLLPQPRPAETEEVLFVRPEQPAAAPQLLPPPRPARQSPRLPVRALALGGWAAGAACTAGWMLAANLRFARLVHKRRRRLDVPQSPVPVYACGGLASPCLFGLRPAVYLTETGGEAQGWALRHELQHLRHGDHIWAAARCVCLAVYWFDPLVWLAAYLSRRDCELACDEGVTACLNARQRLEYARCLLETTPARRAAPVAAPGLSEGAREMKNRLNAITARRAPARCAAVLAVLLAAALAGCTFTAAAAPAARNAAAPQSEAPAAQPAAPTPEPASAPEAAASNENAASEPEAETGSALVWPLPGYAVTAGFSVSTRPESDGTPPRTHNGLDIPAPKGTQVLGSAGAVAAAGWNAAGEGTGLSVVLETADGLVLHYCHCSKLLVEDGGTVEAGQPIAEVGNTGMSAGDHLHWAAVQGGEPIDLQPMFEAKGE